MRRKNALQLKVKAPSRGLVTRLPSNLADLMGESDLHRTFSVAQNVRFEDGVVCNAPGYEIVSGTSGLFNGLQSHWKFDEANGDRLNSVSSGSSFLPIAGVDFIGVAGKLGLAMQMQAGDFGNFNGNYITSQLFPLDFTISGWVKFPNVADLGEDILIKKNGAQTPLKISRASANLTVFVKAITGETLTVTSSVTMANNTWYFFAARLDTTGNLLHIRVNATDTSSAWTHGAIDDSNQGFWIAPASTNYLLDSVSVWNRVLSAGDLDAVYNSGAGLDYPFLSGPTNLLYQANLTGSTPTPLFLGTSTDLYLGTRTFVTSPRTYSLALTKLFTGTAVPAGYRWAAVDFVDKTVFTQNAVAPQYWNTTTATVTAAVPGLPTGSTYDGVESFFGHLLFWSVNTLTWSDLNDYTNYIPVANTVDTSTQTVSFTQPAAGSTVYVAIANTNGLAGGFYRLDDTTGTNFYSVTVSGNAAAAVTTTGTSGGAGLTITVGSATGLAVGELVTGTNVPAQTVVVSIVGTTVTLSHATTGAASGNYVFSPTLLLTSLDKTGRSATSTAFVAVSLVPLRANEAGSAPIIGSQSNGPIWSVAALGDYAYVFKERSVQSIQYVGQSSGTFFVRTEVTDEGLLSRYSALRLGTGRMIVLGQRELYDYQGGSKPVPVCTQYTRQLFAEIDRNNLSQLVMLHREIRNEIWIVYPVIGGGLKVLIWNYFENTATIDVYDSSLHGLTALAMVDWQNDPAWLSLSDDVAWADYSELTDWDQLSGVGKERVALLASGDGNLLIHGNVYSRGTQAYSCYAETMDFDFDDDAIFKYVDVVNVALQVKTQDTIVRNMYIQVGYRSTLDADITWTTAKAVPVQGNANFTAKVNPGGGGRYVRVRFYSTDVDVQWRVSAYEIFARAGGTY